MIISDHILWNIFAHPPDLTPSDYQLLLAKRISSQESPRLQRVKKNNAETKQKIFKTRKFYQRDALIIWKITQHLFISIHIKKKKETQYIINNTSNINY